MKLSVGAGSSCVLSRVNISLFTGAALLVFTLRGEFRVCAGGGVKSAGGLATGGLAHSCVGFGCWECLTEEEGF